MPLPSSGPAIESSIPEAIHSPEDILALQEPDVAAYIRKKNWEVDWAEIPGDEKPMRTLHLRDKSKGSDKQPLTEEDFKILARVKEIDDLNLDDVKDLNDAGVHKICANKKLRGVTSMFNDKLTDASLKSLAECPDLTRVAIRGENFTSQGFRELAKLSNLETLMVSGTEVKGPIFDAFVNAKKLTDLQIGLDGITDDEARNIARLPSLKRLVLQAWMEHAPGSGKLTGAGIKAIVDTRMPEEFQFDHNLIDDALLKSLLETSWLYGPTPPDEYTKRPTSPEEVRSATLDSDKITEKGLEPLSKYKNLKSLSLRGARLTADGLARLAAFQKLNYLGLGAADAPAAGLSALSALPLKHLQIEYAQLTEEHLKACGNLVNLESLNLYHCKLDPKWLVHIAKLPNLTRLSLPSSAFDDPAATAISILPNLEEISLKGTEIGDAGLAVLLKMPKLKQIWLTRTNVSKAAYQKARKDYPKISLSSESHE